MTQVHPGDIVYAWASAQAMNTNKDHDLDIGALKYCYITFVWSGCDTVDPTIELFSSPDGASTTWSSEPSSSYTIPGAAGCKSYDFTLKARGFIRLRYLKGTAAAGTYDIIIRKEMPPQ